MTNKRQAKKYIDRVCVEIVEFLLPGAVYSGIITDEKAGEIINEISTLHTQAIERISVAFDKAPKAFDNAHDYHKARRAYYKTVFGKAIAEFNKGVTAAIAPVNAKK